MAKSDPRQRARRRERTAFIVLVVLLALYGLWNSEGAAALIRAVAEAFSVLLSNP